MNTKKEDKKYPVYEMKDRGKLIITPEVVNQIMFLHSNIGKTEWSGILLYDVVSGNPSNPSEFVLKTKHIFLMDIGTAGATEYSPDSDIVDLYDKIDGAMDMKIGHVHSHHDMSAYFSGTDNDELMTNVDKHNYYLSLIVNFSNNYACKVAFLSEIKSVKEMFYTNDQGQLKKFKQTESEKTMIVINMNIVMGYQDDFFYNRLQEVKDKLKVKEQKNKEQKKLKQYNKNENKNENYYQANFEDVFDNNTSVKIDPNNLSDICAEHLTKNILMLNSNLSETRSVFYILYSLLDSTESDFEAYLNILYESIDEVLMEYFDNRVLTPNELTTVIKSVIEVINKHENNNKLKDLVSEITGALTVYLEDATGISKDRLTEVIELENEIKKLNNELTY